MKIVITATLLMVVGLVSWSAAAESPKPNIIFVLSDDIAQGDLGCYGQKLIKTPNLDRMAAEGTRYLQAYCGTTVCAPSRTSLLTGLHMGHSPIRANREIQPEGQMPLPEGTYTVAQLLKSRGYATACIGKWGMGMLDTTGSLLKHGFDHFFGYNCQRHAHSYFPAYLYNDDRRFDLPGNDGRGVGKTYAQNLIANETLKWVRAQWDFLPTVAELAAAPVPVGVKIDGFSLVAYLKGGPAPRRPYFYWELHEGRPLQTIRIGDWKAVRTGPSKPLELYDLKNDPGETKNLAAENPGLITKAESIIRAARTDDPNWPWREPVSKKRKAKSR